MNLTVDDALPVAIYAFAEFRLDVRRVRLTCGTHEIALTPKAFAVLEYLVRRPGRLVEKRELLAAAWPNVVVEEGNLSQTIYLLRRALGEHPADHRYIVTVPGRGYRFVAEVQVIEIAPPVAGVAPSIAEVDLLAPVECAGLAARATHASAAAPPAAVPSRLGARPVATWAAMVLLAGCAGILYLGTGAQTTERARAAIGSASPPSPSSAPASTVSTRGSTASSAPWSAAVPPGRAADRQATLARARFLFGRREPGDLQRSGAAFEEVLAADANDAAAWTGLAGVFVVEALTGERDRQTGLARARDAVAHALAIDPTLAEAHVRLAMIRSSTGDDRGARESGAAARRFGPESPLVLAGAADEAALRGDFPEAVRLAQLSVDRDPLNVALRVNLAWILVAARRLDEAEAEARRTYEIYPVDGAATLIGQVRLARGDVEGAVKIFAGLRDEDAREHARTLVSVARRQGPDARAALQRLASRVGRADPFAVAEAYALHGDRDRAFEWLERAAPSDGGRGVSPLGRPRWTMAGSPLLAQLHADPRWYEWERSASAGKR